MANPPLLLIRPFPVSPGATETGDVSLVDFHLSSCAYTLLGWETGGKAPLSAMADSLAF
jgi:hypothetical protein